MVSSITATAKRGHPPTTPTLGAVVILICGLSAAASAGQVTIFVDGFQGYDLAANPQVPVVGEPWQISEAAPVGIQVAADPRDPLGLNQVLQFGGYRNTAVAPFSASDRQQVAAAQNAVVSFEHFAFPDDGFAHHFEIGAYDVSTGVPAWLVRFASEGTGAPQGVFDVRYLNTDGTFIDTGLEIVPEAWQPITIAADFAAETFALRVGDDAVQDLPVFACPNQIVGIEFGSYGVSMGSGEIDNLSVGVIVPGAEEQPKLSTPEMATGLLLLTGGITLACAWLLRRKKS